MVNKKLLIDRQEYLSSGCHIGLATKTENMKQFIYKIRPNGLAVLDIRTLDRRIKVVAKIIANSNDPFVVSRKDNAKKAVQALAQTIDCKYVTGRFMPGSLTNPHFEGFFEPDIVMVTDPVADKQVISEARIMRIPVVSLVDTFNLLTYLDLVIPCNNKSKKSLGLIYYLLAKEIIKNKGLDAECIKSDFMPEDES